MENSASLGNPSFISHVLCVCDSNVGRATPNSSQKCSGVLRCISIHAYHRILTMKSLIKTVLISVRHYKNFHYLEQEHGYLGDIM